MYLTAAQRVECRECTAKMGLDLPPHGTLGREITVVDHLKQLLDQQPRMTTFVAVHARHDLVVQRGAPQLRRGDVTTRGETVPVLSGAFRRCCLRATSIARAYRLIVLDKDIRQSLAFRLAEEHGGDPSTRVIPELDLCGRVRVDVAVVNGTLAGYELKSDRDTLKRLPMQVEVYGQVLDYATLVVGTRHMQRAVAELPDWWGVICAHWADDTATLVVERTAQWNQWVEPRALVELLWRDEVLADLEARNLDRGIRSKPRHYMWDRLASEVPLTELRGLVRERLKARQGWRSQPATG